MVFLNISWFLLKRSPRIAMLILLFINTFLLVFLLLGCYSNTSTYSSIYTIRYSFNSSSPIYSLIEESYTDKNLTGYEEMIVKASYMNACIEINDEVSCTSRANLDQYISNSDVSIYTTNSDSSSGTLNLVTLASKFSNEVVHPYILMATIILTLILFLSLFYIIVPGLPYKVQVNKFNLILSPVIALIWGLGATWAHVAGNSGIFLVESGSMGIVKAHVGRKAVAMAWTSFSFATIVAIGIIGLHVRDLHNIMKNDDDGEKQRRIL